MSNRTYYAAQRPRGFLIALNYLKISLCWLGIFGMAYVGLVLA